MDQLQEKTPDERNKEEFPSPAEMLGWLEFGFWTIVALWPFLYWVNGPAVSTDQFVVRAALITLSFAGGITIRLVKWVRSRSRT